MRALYEHLQISSLGELEYACRENRLLALEGFGVKTQENILKGIEHVKRFQGRFLVSTARRVAERFVGVARIGRSGEGGSCWKFAALERDCQRCGSGGGNR